MQGRGIMRAFLRALRRDRRGVAFVEFAFAAPIFVTLVLAGLELANMAIAYMRVSQIAMTVADDSGRVMTGIDEANIEEVFAGAELIGQPLKFKEHGRVVLSSLEPNGRTDKKAGQMITWQRCFGDLNVAPAYGVEGDGKNNKSLRNGLGATGNQIASSDGTAVMFVEVTYDYQPMIGTGFFTPPRMRYESAFNVRGRQNNAITNTQQLTVASC